jgi:hypothetical protein
MDLPIVPAEIQEMILNYINPFCRSAGVIMTCRMWYAYLLNRRGPAHALEIKRLAPIYAMEHLGTFNMFNVNNDRELLIMVLHTHLPGAKSLDYINEVWKKYFNENVESFNLNIFKGIVRKHLHKELNWNKVIIKAEPCYNRFIIRYKDYVIKKDVGHGQNEWSLHIFIGDRDYGKWSPETNSPQVYLLCRKLEFDEQLAANFLMDLAHADFH